MFDTLAVAQQLAAGGVDRDQAEVIAKAIHDGPEQGDHVTSDQFRAGPAEVRAEIAKHPGAAQRRGTHDAMTRATTLEVPRRQLRHERRGMATSRPTRTRTRAWRSDAGVVRAACPATACFWSCPSYAKLGIGGATPAPGLRTPVQLFAWPARSTGFSEVTWPSATWPTSQMRW